MRALLAGTQNGLNLPHSGRFALVSFLHALGMDSEQIMALFAKSPDFDESKTIYQVKHITGEGSGTEYTPPECSTMKSYGICFEPDDLCNSDRVVHPLIYYRIRTRSARHPEADAEEKKV
jgi:DNA primase large subunit